MARIMIADDNNGVSSLFKRIIDHSGHQVIAVSENGLDALRDYYLYDPDLVILDYQMPGMNGLDIAFEILKRDSTEKIIMCTIMPEEIEHKAKMLNIPVISKAITPEHLIDAINCTLQDEDRS